MAGFRDIELNHFKGFFAKGWHGIVGASGLVCVSFMGLTNVARVAEEVKDPERNLTAGILLTLVTSALVHGLGTFVIVGIVTATNLCPSESPSLMPPELSPTHGALRS